VMMMLSLAMFIGFRTGVRETATADMLNAEGKSLGRLSFTQEAAGVRIQGQLSGLPAGPHAMHIHAVGQCHAPDFKTAGVHFNPYGRKHGSQNKDGPHAGDLPNFIVAANGSVEIDTTARLVT